jgi:hypothetical protein
MILLFAVASFLAAFLVSAGLNCISAGASHNAP